MNKFNKYTVIGVMSGTSLDGLDIVKCHFSKKKSWCYEIEKGITIKYSKSWKENLKKTHLKDKKEINQISIDYGRFIGLEINKFIKNDKSKIDFISSHGHTIFHNPDQKFTLQIGDGQSISNTTKLKTISDFRSLDVKLNGQGAPLVPIGDKYLFNDYKYCLNLGGFANVSIKNNDKIIAYDICPANIILNYLAMKLNIEFDRNGEIGEKGSVNIRLLDKLNKLDFYSRQNPKSLSREWLEEKILNMPELLKLKTQDLLATFYEHIGLQIGKILKDETVYITGGGAYNTFLCNRIKKYSNSKIIIADPLNLEFKEAMIFGFLGVLRDRNETNCLKDVTGADRDSCSGVIHLPK